MPPLTHFKFPPEHDPLTTLNHSTILTAPDIEYSKYILYVTLIPNSLLIPIGAVSVILNIMSIAVIFTSKHLRTKCFGLLGANAAANFLTGAAYLATGSVRVHRYVVGDGEIITTWGCFQQLSLVLFSQVLSLGMNAALVTERVLAIFCAIRYKQWTYRQVTLPLIFMACFAALMQLSVYLYDSWVSKEDVLISCGVDDTLSASSAPILVGIQITTSCIVIILHGLLAFGVLKQKKKLTATPSIQNSEAGRREMATMEADMKFMKAISAIVITHICIIGVRFLVIATNIWDNDIERVVANRYGGFIVVLSSTVDFFVLFFMSSRFRDATKKLFHPSIVGVSPMGENVAR